MNAKGTCYIVAQVRIVVRSERDINTYIFEHNQACICFYFYVPMDTLRVSLCSMVACGNDLLWNFRVCHILGAQTQFVCLVRVIFSLFYGFWALSFNQVYLFAVK